MTRLQGIGWYGHMHGATLLENSDPPLRPCILRNESRDTGLPELVHGVMDGVALACADCAKALRAAGTDFDVPHVVGGGARSRQWVSILAAAT